MAAACGLTSALTLRKRVGRSRTIESYHAAAVTRSDPARLLEELVGSGDGPPALSEEYKSALLRDLLMW